MSTSDPTHSRSTGFVARAVGVLALVALAAGTSLASAQAHGGGGGGHGGGGGGAHMSGGGGGHAGGGAHFSGGGGHVVGGGARFSGGFNGGAHFQPRAGYAAGHVYSNSRFVAGRSVSPGVHAGYYSGRSGFYGNRYHGGYYGAHGWVGGSGRFWGGGYWGGRFWPGVHYGPSFAWFLPVLPIGYATYYYGGVPYYYYDNGYYMYDSAQNGYVATDPPPVAGTDDTEAPPASENTDNNVWSNGASTEQGAAPAAGSGGVSDVFVYPRNGQTDEQTSNDRFECHKWSVAQTGFDPTRSVNTQGTPSDYRRAIGACLDARGYTVK